MLVEVLVAQEQAVHVARSAARAVPVPAPVSDATWPQVTAEEAETCASRARPGGRAAHRPCMRPPPPRAPPTPTLPTTPERRAHPLQSP